ncbi:uncharacterized protein LOC143451813 [Clavelina lepadiformis]|uniref:uncharacterized protein LOC143451813 n=1 Tax=Clavelina lepadiformis TaxID=159417 RepID=UPI00404328D1
MESCTYTIKEAHADLNALDFGKDPLELKNYIKKRLDKNDVKQIMELQRQDISPAFYAKLQKCQPTSASVERSFSLLKSFLRPNRGKALIVLSSFVSYNFRNREKTMTSQSASPGKIRLFAASEILCNVKGSLLGRGGFGTVRLGHHQVLGRLAVKCQPMQGSITEMKEAKQGLLKEVKMILLAAHKHVIRIEGLIDEEDWVGVVMEHMSAGSLNDLIFNQNIETIPYPLLLRMSYESADAITYLHKMLKDIRIAHGDLKPQNILLNSDLHCKVADFGGAALSHHTRTATARPDITGEGSQHTLLFSAPERLDPDCDRLTTSMDVYSVGVIFYMMIVRKYPTIANEILFRMTGKFQGVFLQQKLIDEIKNGLKRRKDEQGVRIISLMESIMTKCVDNDPSNRQAMIEIRDQLQELLETIKPTTIMFHAASVAEQVTIRDDALDQVASKPISHVIFGTGQSSLGATVSETSPKQKRASGNDSGLAPSTSSTLDNGRNVGKDLDKLTIKESPQKKSNPSDIADKRRIWIEELKTQLERFEKMQFLEWYDDDNPRRYISLLCELNESSDMELFNMASLRFPKVVNLNGLKLSSSEAAIFCDVLRKQQKELKLLELMSCFSPDDVERLISAISEMPGKV